MHQEQFIERLATKLELPKLTFNSESVCRLVLDDQFVVDLEWVEDDNAIYVYSVVHNRASEVSDRFGELLAANLFGRGTNYAVLGLDVEREEILMTRKFRLKDLNLDWFLEELESFVKAVSEWSLRLDRDWQTRMSKAAESFEDDQSSGFLRV